MTVLPHRRANRSLAWVPGLDFLLRQPPVRRMLRQLASLRGRGTGWARRHPFDRLNGTDTSGMIGAEELPTDEGARVHAVCYAGSQPSILRAVLARLPDRRSLAFVDLGCGKGRALLVASEFGFRDIVGVELSAPLAAVARRNARRYARRYPRRAAIRVVTGDASRFAFPAGDMALFLYHPFSAELVAAVAARIARTLAEPGRRVYAIYYNPVAGHCFDACPGLSRLFAATLPYAPAEIGFGPDASDTVVIWQGGAVTPAPAGHAADAAIVLTANGRRARLLPA